MYRFAHWAIGVQIHTAQGTAGNYEILRMGGNGLSHRRAHRLVTQYQMIGPENIYIRNLQPGRLYLCVKEYVVYTHTYMYAI